jgi:hypothetical protein
VTKDASSKGAKDMQHHPCVILFAIIATALGSEGSKGADAKDLPTDIVSQQIRKQGYPCKSAISTQKDLKHPKVPGGWILKCSNATYHVHLVPRRPANVSREN